MALQRAFGDVLAERGQIAAALPVQRRGYGDGAVAGTPSTEAAGATVGGSDCVTLSCAFLARGRSEAVPHSDFVDCVRSAQQSLRFPAWNQNACKVW